MQAKMKSEFYISNCHNADVKYRHKYTLFISADGNFRLQRKRKNDDPDDLALNGGRFPAEFSERMFCESELPTCCNATVEQ